MFFNLVAILAGLAAASSCFAGGGESNGGNGGAFCRLGNEPLKPCDLFFSERDWTLPYSESQRSSLEAFPESVRAELQAMNDLIRNRSLGEVDVLAALKDSVLIYDTPTFLGEDTHGIDAHGTGRQVGYAYWFNRVDRADKTRLETVRVIELDLAFLKTVPARYQALAILHEYLHFGPKLDHAVISPLLKALDRLLVIRDEQAQGARRMLTDEELAISRDFQAYLVHLGFSSQTYARTIVHPYGGGVVSFDKAEDAKSAQIDESNFVGIDASVRELKAGAAYYWKGGVVQGEMARVDMPTSSKNLDTYSIGGGVEVVDVDGAQRTDWVLNAALTPRTKCLSYNGKGTCDEHAYWFPLEFKGRAGGDNRVERFAVTLYSRKFSVQNTGSRVEGSSCTLHVGRVTYEQLRHELGTVLTTSLSGFDCELALKILKSGNLKLIGGFGAAGGPWGIIGTTTWWTSRMHPSDSDLKMGGTTLSLRFTGSAGVQIFDTASVSAFGTWDGAGSRSDNLAHLDRATYGTRMRLKANDRFYLDASLYTNRDEVSWITGKAINGWDVKAVTESYRYYEKVFGITLGGHHDLMGR